MPPETSSLRTTPHSSLLLLPKSIVTCLGLRAGLLVDNEDSFLTVQEVSYIFLDNSMILLLLLAGKMQETGGISASGFFSISPLSTMGRVVFSLFSHA